MTISRARNSSPVTPEISYAAIASGVADTLEATVSGARPGTTVRTKVAGRSGNAAPPQSFENVATHFKRLSSKK